MRWLNYLLLLIVITACGAATSPPESQLTTSIGSAESAVINLNIFNRDAQLTNLAPESDLLISADVGDTHTVTYITEQSAQAYIALSDNPNQASTFDWAIKTSPSLPISYVIDVTDGDFRADLTQLNIPRFDIVSINSTLDITFPSSAFQMAVDVSDSTAILAIPALADIQSAQVTTSGGLLTMTVDEGVRFISNLTVTAGGMTLIVPASTGVQIIVERAENSEITLPNRPRTIAEPIIYTTPDFEQSSAQILLNSTLIGAAIRIVQE
ncbi:MAG: hypothetical protein WBC91_10930 [Phototrophicaceae bacterium]